MTKRDEEAITRIMNGLKCSREEALEILVYDKRVEKGEATEHDLDAEQEKVAKKMSNAGKGPRVYNLTKTRERKPNETKGSLIAGLAEYLSTIDVENVNITNKERQIAFDCNGNSYELTLTQKRKKK